MCLASFPLCAALKLSVSTRVFPAPGDYYLNLNVIAKPQPSVQMSVTLTKVRVRQYGGSSDMYRFLG